MDEQVLACADERRRKTARDLGWNGIDDVEVSDDPPSLCVSFFGRVPENVGPANVRIEGGRRVRGIKVVRVEPHRSEDPEQDDCLEVAVDRLGDFSAYTLRLVEAENGKPTNRPLAGFDPRYAQVRFSFRVNCAADLDCKAEPPCPPDQSAAPAINYLAKDYASFRQLILDRLALIMPGWRERHAPDIGIALVELLAYVGDHLSYYQDSVATEAYLDTARRRISVRRHARLVDYQMHEGCNARAWLRIRTDQDRSLPAADLAFLTSCPELAELGATVVSAEQLRAIPASHYEVFEPLVADGAAAIQLYADHNAITLYTWGDAECCLPRGATRATLRDGWVEPTETTDDDREKRQNVEAAGERGRKLRLQPGDYLLFEEVKGPRTGADADADPTRRHVVRLTDVQPDVDPLDDTPVLEVAWASADALPFSLCVSTRLPATHDGHPCEPLTDVSVARGNVLLVDHGRTLDAAEDLGVVAVQAVVGECHCEGSAIERRSLPAPFTATLKAAPLTFRQPLPTSAPASALLEQDAHGALPQLTLVGLPTKSTRPIDPADPGWRWQPRFDLLGSGTRDQHVAVELDNDGRAHLRFGDDDLGRHPAAGLAFSASYRIGSGVAGNVGAATITHMLVRKATLSGADIGVSNPLPARGGAAPETIAEVKLYAPHAFRRERRRAITAADYAELAEGAAPIQRAAAAMRWTGSWYEVGVAVDPRGGEADPALLDQIDGLLHRYRRAGHDLQVGPARYVAVEIELNVCVAPHALRGEVKAAVLERLSTATLADGRLGFFHPDNLTFGGGIFLSSLVAAAQAVPGVQSVSVTKLQRLFERPNGELDAGLLPLGPLEIARCDNDRDFPENGMLHLIMRGGR